MTGVQTCALPIWAAFARPAYRVQAFQGTLLTDKADATGTYFRRNRHYAPVSARFTQEDPIGLAGGLNLYGFAGGDPVNFADPFGLCPWCKGEAFQEIGRRLQPIQPVLEAAGLALMMVPMASESGIVTLGIGARAAVGGLAGARALGAAGEAASGLIKITQRIPSATGTAAFRVPDGLSATTLSEVKNVSRLSLTNQLRDFSAFASENRLGFDLYVRSNTQLTGPLKQFIRNNNIDVRILK